MTARIVPDMAAEDYHAARALSASGAHLLTSECPSVYWWRSPFNPAFAPVRKPVMDFGTAVHLAVLEPARLGERIALVDADDWRGKRAREERDEAYIAGRVPLLPHDLDLVADLARRLHDNPWVADLLDGAETEMSYFWDWTGVPCKARADILTRDRAVIADLKSAHSANPEAIRRAAWDQGWHLRAPWYCQGWQAVTGETIQDYFFVVIDRDPPHPITICRLDPRALAWGEMMMRRALRLFRRCSDAGEWPGYARGPITLDLPAWAEHRLADEEASGALSSDDVRLSMDFLDPRGPGHAR